MFALLAQFAFLLQRFVHLARPRQELARSLMEDAESRAGIAPRQARELRRAARAYLSVVR